MMASLGCHKLPEAYSLKKEEPSMFYNDSDILKSSIRLTGILDISANSFHHTAYMCKKISEYSDNPLTNKECFSYNSTDEEIPESVSKIQEDKQPELERICQIIEDMNLNEDNKMNQEDIKAIIDQYQGADTIFSLIKSSQEERINLEDGRTETTNSITVYYDIGKNGRLDLILQSKKIFEIY
jgi:gas vesicle protein